MPSGSTESDFSSLTAPNPRLGIPSMITLEELHTVARQNLIASTQACIARQLLSCPEAEADVENDITGEDLDICIGEDIVDIPALEDDHEQQTGPVNKKTLCCPHQGCDRKFTWPAHFKYHQMTHLGTRPHACPVNGCGLSFYTSQRLSVHMRTHTGEKPFTCSHKSCGKKFTTAGNMKNHMRTHTGERPFVCTKEGCKKKFAEYSSLKKHLLVHSGEKPFLCEFCGKTFSQSGSRNVHQKRHHGENEKSSEDTSAPSSGEDEQQVQVVDAEGRNITATLSGDGQKVIILEEKSSKTVTIQDLSSMVLSQTSDTEHLVTVTATIPDSDAFDSFHPGSLLTPTIVAQSDTSMVVLTENQEVITISGT